MDNSTKDEAPGRAIAKEDAVSTTPDSHQQAWMFPDEQCAIPIGDDMPIIGQSTRRTSAPPPDETTAETHRGKFHDQEEQGMPPLAEHTLTDTHSCARLLSTFSDRLVVAHTQGADLQSLLYVVDSTTGLVSSGRDQILALSMQIADNLVADYKGLVGEAGSSEGENPASDGPPSVPSRGAVINHARGLRSARAAYRHQKVVGGVVEHDLRTGGSLASWLTVLPHEALDADMSVIGTPLGVLDIRSLRTLLPGEGGALFISRSTGVEYHRDARDPHVDRILPSPSEVDHQSRVAFIMRWLGWHITHPPKRDFLGLISEGNSGKSSLINTIVAGLGDYVQVIRPEALAARSGHPGAHNDELLLFGGGRRLVVVMEARRSSRELLNLATGGDPLPTRPIRRAAVQVTVTAGLAIVGNPPGAGQSTGAVLGIGGNDEVSAALRDRARIVRLPRRGGGEGNPPDDRKLAVAAQPLTRTTHFREAALARLVEWAVVMMDQSEPPEPTAEMVGDQMRQESAERPLWVREFIPRILTTDPRRAVLGDAETGRSGPRPADSYSVYQEYLVWHEANGDGEPPASRRTVTDALLHHYRGLRDVARETKIPGGGVRHKTNYFDGYYICDPDANSL